MDRRLERLLEIIFHCLGEDRPIKDKSAIKEEVDSLVEDIRDSLQKSARHTALIEVKRHLIHMLCYFSVAIDDDATGGLPPEKIRKDARSAAQSIDGELSLIADMAGR